MKSDDDDFVLYQTRYWRVTLAPDQYYLGRAYVTALRHVPSLGALTFRQWSDLQQVIGWYEAAAAEVLGAALVTWVALMNNAFRDADPVPHVHWHVRPRYSHDVEFAGQTFSDPEFGGHHQREKTRALDDWTMQRIAENLTQHADRWF